jgi:integrase
MKGRSANISRTTSLGAGLRVSDWSRRATIPAEDLNGESSYKPIVLDPSSAAKIFETLSGAERALSILVAATGIRISEALGLRWEDIDYQTKQINLRRVWVSKTIVERLKTDDSEAPVPLTDLLPTILAGLAKGDCVRKTRRLGFR